ncbi:MAG: branched-chain amino acid ABC transporter permease [Herpetosiphon sp.]
MAVSQPTATTPVVVRRRLSAGRLLVGTLMLVILASVLVPIVRQAVESPGLLVQQLWIGLINGAIIAIIALGYTMVYGIIELINFAHGDVFMLGAFFTLILLSLTGVTRSTAWYLLYPALLFVFIAVTALCAGINIGIERFAYRRLRNAPRLAPLISAIGVSFILQNVGLWISGREVRRGDYWAIVSLLVAVAVLGLTWVILRRVGPRLPRWAGIMSWLGGMAVSYVAFTQVHGLLQRISPAKLSENVMGSSPSAQKSVPDVLPNATVFRSGSIVINVRDVMVLGIAVVLMAALYTFVKTTKLGKAMRATAQDRDAARLMGINVNQTIMLAFLLGGLLAGAAGMIVALYNGTVVFTLGFTRGLQAFTSAVLGGIGNIAGAMLGGLLIGFLASLSDTYISTRWTNAVVFAVLVVILVFRPSGLLGEDVGQKA